MTGNIAFDTKVGLTAHVKEKIRKLIISNIVSIYYAINLSGHFFCESKLFLQKQINISSFNQYQIIRATSPLCCKNGELITECYKTLQRYQTFLYKHTKCIEYVPLTKKHKIWQITYKDFYCRF